MPVNLVAQQTKYNLCLPTIFSGLQLYAPSLSTFRSLQGASDCKLVEMTRTEGDHQTTGTDIVYSWSLGITQLGNIYSVDGYQVAVDSVVHTHFFPLVLSISC